MLDTTLWELDGDGRRVARAGGPDGKIIEEYNLFFYRHREKGQVKIIQERNQ